MLFMEQLWVSWALYLLVTLALTLNLSGLGVSVHATILALSTLWGGCEGSMRQCNMSIT